MIKKLTGLTLLVTLALLNLINQAHAAGTLVQQDLVSQGKVVTTVWDSDTKLQWLTPAATTRQTAISVLSGFGGWVSSGFRYATPDEFAGLLEHSGLTGVASMYANSDHVPMDGRFNWNTPDDVSKMQWLITAIGSTYENNPPSQGDAFGQKTTYGILGDMSSAGGLIPHSLSYASFGAGRSWASASMGGQWSYLSEENIIGSFLVRNVSAVSEPTEALLMLTGLFAVIGMKRRHALKNV